MPSQTRDLHYGDHYRNTPERRILDMLLLVGCAYEKDHSAAEASARQALERWITLGLVIKHQGGARLFDPVEVLNFCKTAGLEGRDGFWAGHFVATHRQAVVDLKARGDNAHFRVYFRRNFQIGNASARLRLRMPLPLPDPYVYDLEITPFIEAAGDFRVELRTGRLEARMTAPCAGELTMGAELVFHACRRDDGDGASLDARESELYLRPREGLIVVTERIQGLAQSLVPSSVTTIESLRGFWNYIMDEFRCGAIHYDQVRSEAPCDWVLDTGWFDCQLASALFVALCRARGIPARLIGGHLLYRLLPTNHYWAEAWLEERGWVPVDFLSWDLSRGGRDAAWRDTFFGHLDPRMVTQVMPLAFTGAPGLPVPADFIVLQARNGEDVEISLQTADGTPIYSDRLRFRT